MVDPKVTRTRTLPEPDSSIVNPKVIKADQRPDPYAIQMIHLSGLTKVEVHKKESNTLSLSCGLE